MPVTPASPSTAPPAGDESRFRAIFEQAPIGMLLLTRDRIITRANAACCELLGTTEDRIVGRPSPELSIPEDRPAGVSDFERMLAGEFSSFRVEKRLVHPSGRPRWAECVVSFTPDAEPDAQVIVQMVDVTERKRVEEALAQRGDELERSNAELEQFAYVASHDLSEPLRTVSGFMKLLSHRHAESLDDEARTFIDYAVTGTERMQRMIDDLLLYSRAGRPDLALEPVDLADVARIAVASLSETITATGARIEVGPLPEVLGHRGQLAQVMQNVLGNALKFVAPGTVPQVTVRGSSESASVLVRVEDNGIGIDPGMGERVFKMFQRLHEREAYDGTGIGLAICRKVIERHGGRIWCEPREEGGTRFSFTLRGVEEPGGAHPAAALTEEARA